MEEVDELPAAVFSFLLRPIVVDDAADDIESSTWWAANAALGFAATRPFARSSFAASESSSVLSAL